MDWGDGTGLIAVDEEMRGVAGGCGGWRAMGKWILCKGAWDGDGA